MNLYTDEQTIEDLGLFGKRNEGGIYDLYNHTNTRGGETILKELFRKPLSDREAISRRSSIIENFARLNFSFPFKAGQFDMSEKYLLHTEDRTKGHIQQNVLSEKDIQNGVMALIELMQELKIFIEKKEVTEITAYANEREHILMILSDPAFEPVLKEKLKGKPSYSAITAYDVLFRIREYAKVEELIGYIYQLDVYVSVAKLAVERKFVFPKVLEKGRYEIKLEGVYHPELKNPVGNTIDMNVKKSVFFLTGANMAGKSTLLRSLSTAMYIAHMGFPVAARSMEFSVMDGIYTTINLPDNLGIGASHFYAEVLRVKKMATELSLGKSLFIVFDELFRGTNVKDAHEATVAITNAFAEKKTSFFIISSHIVEAGEELKQKNNIGFLYLPTRMNGHIPQYTYTLEEGITEDRHGMIIIRNEGILETLKNGLK